MLMEDYCKVDTKYKLQEVISHTRLEHAPALARLVNGLNVLPSMSRPLHCPRLTCDALPMCEALLIDSSIIL